MFVFNLNQWKDPELHQDRLIARYTPKVPLLSGVCLCLKSVQTCHESQSALCHDEHITWGRLVGLTEAD